MILLFFFVKCDNPLNYKKDKWLKEDIKIRYSEKSEKEVWGKVLDGYTHEIFYGTPVYELAKELNSFYWFRSDKKIEELIVEIPKESINLQEEKFGTSIGIFALRIGNLKAVRLLLDWGLNPNIVSNNGSSLIKDINGPGFAGTPEGLETLRYMINKGADVNLSPVNDSETPLMQAACFDLPNVKILVDAGANPHYFKENIPEDGISNTYGSPLYEALIWNRIDIVNFLIFDQKVNYKAFKYTPKSKFHPGEYEILYRLREMFYELNSKEYKEKVRLVAYLKTQGLDYWKTPVPERFLDYEIYTKEYLSKY